MKKLKIKNILSLFVAMGLSGGAFAHDVVTNANPEMHYYLLTALAIILLIVIAALNGAIRNITSGKALWEKMKNNNGAAALITFLLMMAGNSVFAQAAAEGDLEIIEPNYGLMFWLFVLVDVLLIIVVLVQLSTLSGLVNAIKGDALSGEYAEVETGFDRFWKNLTKAAPVGREAEVMTDHEYDGIKELDNVLPPWWLYLFYITIVFAVIYFGYYEVYKTTPMSVDEYKAEMAEAEKLAASVEITAETVQLIEDEASLANGKAVFDANCVSCHLADGGGLIGPNLTDKYWKNGKGTVNDVFGIITDGVPGTAMVSWKALISPKDRQDLSSYILVKLQGSTPANPKAPEGNLVE